MPTVRQIKAAEALVDGAPSIAAAARIAGFKEGYVRNGLLAGTKGFNAGIALAKARKADKARTLIDRIEALVSKAARAVDGIKLEGADPMQAIAVLKLSVDTLGKSLDIESVHGRGADDAAKLEAGESKIDQALRVGAIMQLRATRRSNGDAATWPRELAKRLSTQRSV